MVQRRERRRRRRSANVVKEEERLGGPRGPLEKKALQGARLRAIKRSVETFRLALGGRRTLGAGSSVIPEICCQRCATEAPPSSCGRTIGGHASRAPH
jgi:hypothetical protein